MKDLDVICLGCRKSFHSTTEAFNPYRPVRGHMVRLKDPWRKWGWCSFGDMDNGLPPRMAEKPATLPSMMDCPGCGAPLAPGGRLTVRCADGKPFVNPPEEFYKLKPFAPVVPLYTDEELEAEWNERIVLPLNYADETREDKILRMKRQEMTNAEIGAEVGLSAERVRQILKRDVAQAA